MITYVLKRIALIVPTVLVVSAIVFSMLHLIPGDAARNAAGPNATNEDIELIRVRNGLDQPLITQYRIWISRALQGDLGVSFRSRRAVKDEIARRFPATLQLAATAMLIALSVGIPMGVLASLKPNSILDHVVTGGSVIGVSIPDFVLGLLLMLLLSSYLGLLPPTGGSTPAHLIMPALTLSAAYVANFARLVRSNMMAVVNDEFVRTARAKGLLPHAVIWRHALPNAILPLITLVGVQFGRLLGGAVIVETIFAWPGLGRYMMDGLMARDYNVVQGCVLIFGITVVLCNALSEVASRIVDPRTAQA